MFRVSRKLKLLKNVIKELSKQNYSGIEEKTAQAHDKMLQAQNVMLTSPSVSNASSEIQAVQDWEELSTAEASFFFQRSRINWISFGDGSTRFFHRYAASRQAQNHIHFLISDSGARIDSQIGIQEQCVNYFSNLLGSPVSQPMFIQSDLDLLFDFKCSAEQIAGFEKPFTADDIRKAFCTLPKKQNWWSRRLFSGVLHCNMVSYRCGGY